MGNGGHRYYQISDAGFEWRTAGNSTAGEVGARWRSDGDDDARLYLSHDLIEITVGTRAAGTGQCLPILSRTKK